MTDASAVIDESKTGSRAATARKKPHARSRVGNGKALMAGIDQRSLAYREYQDTVADLVSHMGNAPSVAEEALIEEAAGFIVWCRQARLALLQGMEFDISRYSTAVNSLRRLLVDLGLEQRLQTIEPSLEDYIARHTQSGGSAAEEGKAA